MMSLTLHNLAFWISPYTLEFLGAAVAIGILLMLGIVLAAKRHRLGGAGCIALAALLICVQFDRRSATGRLIRFRTGETFILQAMDDLMEDAKLSINPYELQRWVMPLLIAPRNGRSSRQLSVDELPPNVRKLTSDGAPIADVFLNHGETSGETHIIIAWDRSGGVGWGIVVGLPDYKPVGGDEPGTAMTGGDDNMYTEWIPGVFFWRTTH